MFIYYYLNMYLKVSKYILQRALCYAVANIYEPDHLCMIGYGKGDLHSSVTHAFPWRR